MFNIMLAAYLIGTPIGTPGVGIALFESRKDCQAYIDEGSGWMMLRSTFGLPNGYAPVPGFVLVCTERT